MDVLHYHQRRNTICGCRTLFGLCQGATPGTAELADVAHAVESGVVDLNADDEPLALR